jgi:2-hydroxymuconate-semialdehyde hydrolase
MPEAIISESRAEDTVCELIRFANRELLSKAGRREITLDCGTPILDMGILDSLSMVSLLSFVQTSLGVAIPDEMVLPDHFESLGTLANLIEQLRAKSGCAQDRPVESALLQSIKLFESSGIRRRWLAGAGGEIHALEVPGAQPAWVLLPGLGNPSSSWGAVLKSLRDETAAVALDFPGFGISRWEKVAPDYQTQVDAVRDAVLSVVSGPFVLIGSSAGSLIATEIARQVPEKVSALVITGFGLVADPPAWRDMLYRLAAVPEDFLKASYYRPPKLTDTLRGLIDEVMSRPAFHTFLDGKGIEAMSSAFEGLQIPTLFVAGREDRIIPPEAVEAAARRVPGARVEWLARCGHFPPAEQPEELIYYIRDFLQSLK